MLSTVAMAFSPKHWRYKMCAMVSEQTWRRWSTGGQSVSLLSSISLESPHFSRWYTLDVAAAALLIKIMCYFSLVEFSCILLCLKVMPFNHLQQLGCPKSMPYIQCSRIRILCFFSDLKKHDFLRFFEMTYQKVVKSRNQVSSLLNVYRNFGLKTPGCYGYF